MAVTITQIKDLQNRTGAGLMDCKKALLETDGDVEKAIDILREKGIAKAASKAGRVAAEGLTNIKICDECHTAVIVEVNCETDFVSGSPKFVEFVDAVTDRLLQSKPATLEEAKEVTQDLFTDAVVAMRENFVLRRFAIVKAEEGQAFGSYIHMHGKISSLVVVSQDAGEVNRGLAMTVASAAPEYLTLEDVSDEIKARELKIAQAEVAEDPKLQAKPENVRAMIAERKVAARLGDACLGSKPYALDPDGKLTVDELCKQKGLKVISFVRYMVGEGVDKTAAEE